jgi:hypothetical protein
VGENSSLLTIEEVSFDVVLVFKAGLPLFGTAYVGGSFCPITVPPNYSASGIIPRFLDTSTSIKAFDMGVHQPVH